MGAASGHEDFGGGSREEESVGHRPVWPFKQNQPGNKKKVVDSNLEGRGRVKVTEPAGRADKGVKVQKTGHKLQEASRYLSGTLGGGMV